MDGFAIRNLLFATIFIASATVFNFAKNSEAPREPFSSNSASVVATLASDLGPKVNEQFVKAPAVRPVTEAAVVKIDEKLAASVISIFGNLEDKNSTEAKAVSDKNLQSGATPAKPAVEANIVFNPTDLTAAVVFAKPLDGNKVLLEKSAGARWPIASITKLMTALVAVENASLDKEVVITGNSVAADGNGGGFVAGEKFFLRDLLKATLLISSNDAATAISDFYDANPIKAGYAFADQMQEKAHELGMSGTTFADATGLSFLNQSTVNDIEKLVSYIYKNRPEILEMTRTPQANIIERTSGSARTLVNINAFAGKPEFLGGKTGFIDASGGNLVSLFKLHNQPFLIVVLGSGDRFGDTEKIYNWAKGQ